MESNYPPNLYWHDLIEMGVEEEIGQVELDFDTLEEAGYETE